MTSSRRLAFAAIVSVVGVACATAVPETGGGSAGASDGGLGAESGISSYGGGGGDNDAGPPLHPPKDGGTAPPIDSGTPPVVDSGSPVTGSPDDCSGTESEQLGETYAKACDYYYEHSDPTGAGNPCTPGGSDCSALNTSTLTFCCYSPSKSAFCYDDYSGVSQCIPQ